MEQFIWWSFGIACFGIVVRMLALSFLPYPRYLKYERWEDSLSVCINSAWVIWAWIVLH